MVQEEQYLQKSRRCQPLGVARLSRVHSQTAPALATAASIVGLFQLPIVSNTPSFSSPLLVNPVTILPEIIDFFVVGSTIPGKIAAPWHLCRMENQQIRLDTDMRLVTTHQI